MSWPGFLFKGPYAFYVWGSYGLTLLAMGGEVLLLLRRRRAQRDDTHDDAASVSNHPPSTLSTPRKDFGPETSGSRLLSRSP